MMHELVAKQRFHLPSWCDRGECVPGNGEHFQVREDRAVRILEVTCLSPNAQCLRQQGHPSAEAKEIKSGAE